jgi:lysophospholipase L1-like esterase
MNRRLFLQKTAVFPAAAVITPSIYSSVNPAPAPPLPKGLRILFQGDSITDAGRDRGRYYANQGQGLGGGYAYQISADLLGKNPDAQLKCFNRGISGNKVYQLANRWDLDCLALKPDVLSILIGVNDYWHTLSGNYNGTLSIYKNDFRQLLEQTKKALPDVKIIIGEPFAVEGGSAIDVKWTPFSAYRVAAKEIANDFDAAFIPYHSIFRDALRHADVNYWCPDGVHPSIAGAYLMKEAWLKAFESLM